MFYYSSQWMYFNGTFWRNYLTINSYLDFLHFLFIIPIFFFPKTHLSFSCFRDLVLYEPYKIYVVPSVTPVSTPYLLLLSTSTRLSVSLRSGIFRKPGTILKPQMTVYFSVTPKTCLFTIQECIQIFIVRPGIHSFLVSPVSTFISLFYRP